MALELDRHLRERILQAMRVELRMDEPVAYVEHALDRVLDLLPSSSASAPEALPEERRYTEADLLTVIEERDNATEWADKLAAVIAPQSVIGEHSSENDPWLNALIHAEGGPWGTEKAWESGKPRSSSAGSTGEGDN